MQLRHVVRRCAGMTHEQRKTLKNRLYNLRADVTALQDATEPGQSVTTDQLKKLLSQVQELTSLVFEINDATLTQG